MQKELDLTTANIAREKYDVERIKRKSIQDKNNLKKQPVYGELYRGKKIKKRNIKAYAVVAASVLMIMAGSKEMNKFAETSTYKAVLHQEANQELSAADSIKFLESYDVSKKEHYDTYIDALESLDDTEYTFFGDRKDGTHNETLKENPNTFVQLSDKQKDAIDIAVAEELNEYKRGK